MATYNKFYSTVVNWLNSSMNFTSDTFKAFLTNTAPNASGWTVYSTATASSQHEIATGNGYSSGGVTITITTSKTTGTISVFATYGSPTWTGTSNVSSAGFGPFEYVVFYDATTLNLLAYPRFVVFI